MSCSCGDVVLVQYNFCGVEEVKDVYSIKGTALVVLSNKLYFFT